MSGQHARQSAVADLPIEPMGSIVCGEPIGRPSMALAPIGYVRSNFTSPKEIPVLGGPATILVSPNFSEALDGIELSSHLLVVGWMHEANRALLRNSRPRMHPIDPRLGVFATRCPSRPNPISISVARLVKRSGHELQLDRLDLADGTPIIDLKPYLPDQDTTFNATRTQRLSHDTLSQEALVNRFTATLERHLGARAESASARTALMAVANAVKHYGVDPRDARLTVAVNRADAAADALMALMGATFASGRIRFLPFEERLRFRFRFAHGGRWLELRETEHTAFSLASPGWSPGDAFSESGGE